MNNTDIQKTVMATFLMGGLLGLGLFLHDRYKQNLSPAKLEEGAPDTLLEEEAKMKVALKKTQKATSSKKTQAKKTALPSNANNTTLPKCKMAVPKFDQKPYGDEFPLRLGSKGKRVERLRIWLMRNYGWTGIINDEFDKQTEQLLKRYLKKTQLDEKTYHRLKMGQALYTKP